MRLVFRIRLINIVVVIFVWAGKILFFSVGNKFYSVNSNAARIERI